MTFTAKQVHKHRADLLAALVGFRVGKPVTPEPDFIDDIAVERACGGTPTHLTTAEKQEAVYYLHQHHLTASQIADRLHMNHRTVQRFLAAIQSESVA